MGERELVLHDRTGEGALGTVTPRALRDAAGRFATGVTVIAALRGTVGRGMTANSFTSVSIDPPLVCVCIDRRSAMAEVIGDLGAFTVSVLGADQGAVARYFADRRRPPGRRQFDAVSWRPGPVTGAPFLDGALAWLECEVYGLLDGGDHDLVLARVVHLECGTSTDPLLFFDGGYREVAPPADDEWVYPIRRRAL